MILKSVAHWVKWCLFALFTASLIIACNGHSSAPTLQAEPTNDSARSATRLVQHDMGETRVPVNPQRVVTLDTGHLANAVALGIQPIGSTAWYRTDHQSGLSPVEPYLGDRLEELTILGYGFTADQVNLETLLSLKPDLIIAVTPHKAIYDQLSQIAPTVLYEYPSADEWKDFLRSSSIALGKTQEAEILLNEYEQRIQSFQQQMGHRLSTQISVIHPLKEGTRIMYRGFFGGSVIQDAGLARPPEQDKEEFNSQPVSAEWIPQMDGDVMFVISFGDDESLNVVDQLKQQPLWSQLNAVQQNKIYPVNAEHWYGGDIVAANRVLDDLFRFLLEEE
ncbi:ABC transporter substrate-binding protein [Egbenema bharatensis]|uniref:ABC transporter substrate-binding protein n=1 Tax=Egbenema bharatensis TaxID=3463334 RepID=UPI003A88D837